MFEIEEVGLAFQVVRGGKSSRVQAGDLQGLRRGMHGLSCHPVLIGGQRGMQVNVLKEIFYLHEKNESDSLLLLIRENLLKI